MYCAAAKLTLLHTTMSLYNNTVIYDNDNNKSMGLCYDFDLLALKSSYLNYLSNSYLSYYYSIYSNLSNHQI